MNKKLNLLGIISIVLALSLTALLLVLLLTSCGSQTKSNTKLEEIDTDSERGVIVLSINPKIEIEYDKNGKVTDVRGTNKDGTNLVKGYDNYIGKDSTVVLQELVDKINTAGYFVHEVGSQAKTLTLELKEGSYLPNEDFIVNIGKAVEEKVSELNLDVELDTNNKDNNDKESKDNNHKDNKDSKKDNKDDSNAITITVPTTKDQTDYDETDYDPTTAPTVDDTDYDETDYDPTVDDTDYDETDYAPTAATTEDYTDYDETDYAPTAAPTAAPIADNSDYEDSDYDD
ncbi:MAG: hypothetical protein GX328_04110 [Clostridiaceae bacterium]|nr:hypothetical protein [Clostridiaceae bacterium]